LEGLAPGTYRVDFEVDQSDITRINRVLVRAGYSSTVNATLYPSGVCECIDHTPPIRLQERAGRVVGEADQPLPHARLELVTPARRETAYADSEGRFKVRLAVDGTWPLVASDTGFNGTTLHVSGMGEPIVVKLKRAKESKTARTERFSRDCRCGGDFFTHAGR
jgi:hypothetical protein